MILQLSRIPRLIGLLVYFLLPAVGIATYPLLPTSLPPPGGAPIIVTDENNHALAIYNDSDTGDILNYYFSNNVWTSIPFPIAGTFGFSVAMEPSGIAIIQVDDGIAINTFSFNGISWTALNPDPLDANASGGGGVALLGPGQGLTAWSDSGSNVVASFLTASTWGAATTLGTGGSNISVAYSSNGTAVVGWEDSGNVYASHYNGGVWSLLPTLVGPGSSLLSLGIDANGNAISLMLDEITGHLIASNFNGVTWAAPVIVGLAPDLAFSSQPLAMSANGTAVAVWQHKNTFFNIYDNFYRVFDGVSWGPAVLFQSGSDGPQGSVSIDDNGNALIIYGLNVDLQAKVIVGQLPARGWLTTQMVYVRPSDSIADVSASIASNGFSAIGWGETNDGVANPFVAAAFTLEPPTNGAVVSIKNKFAMQTDRVNIISFVPSADPAMVAYSIRRNGALVANIPVAGPYIYYDGNRLKGQTDVYAIVSVNAEGQESIPVVVTARQ